MYELQNISECSFTGYYGGRDSSGLAHYVVSYGTVQTYFVQYDTLSTKGGWR